MHALYQILIQLGPPLEKIRYNIQCETIAKMFNELQKEYKVYGLGEAKVIKKRRKLDKIGKTLSKSLNYMISIVAGNHAITSFNCYIFDST